MLYSIRNLITLRQRNVCKPILMVLFRSIGSSINLLADISSKLVQVNWYFPGKVLSSHC